MVVGVYTIINTIGLLVGLPLNLTSTHNDFSLDINNSLSFLTSTNWTDYYIIVETENANLFSSQLSNNLLLTINLPNGSYGYAYNSKVDNYLIFSNDAYDTDVSNYYTARIDFSTGITFDTNQLVIKQIYYAQTTDSFTSIDGNSIISSITSGLGLMGDITTNFKNGFSALIWNSEQNSLTTFGNFVLIFLGVSITFAIIKLCLNLIRSKTGA